MTGSTQPTFTPGRAPFDGRPIQSRARRRAGMRDNRRALNLSRSDSISGVAGSSPKGPTMTFPEDHVKGVKRVEDHSTASVVIVSLTMIAAALAGLTLVIP